MKTANQKQKMQNTTKTWKQNIGTNPEKYIPELNDQFLKAQSASGVEVVTGATHSSESFQNYAQQLIQAARLGDTRIQSKSTMVLI